MTADRKTSPPVAAINSPAADSPANASNPVVSYNEKSAPLQNAEDYRLWVIRHQMKLMKMGSWDEKAELPINNPASNTFIVEAISDSFLQQVMDTDLKASTIWKYLATLILKGGVSAQSTALLNLMNFSYTEATMLENKTHYMGLGRALRTAFNNATTISIDDLIALFALVNMPSEHQSLRTTLEETKKDDLTLESLFESLIREEAKTSGSANRAGRAFLANAHPHPPGQCAHKREEATCWKCHPSLIPTCQLCKKAGLTRFNHPPGCRTCKLQRMEMTDANAKKAVTKTA